jgi:hypothetical protein
MQNEQYAENAELPFHHRHRGSDSGFASPNAPLVGLLIIGAIIVAFIFIILLLFRKCPLKRHARFGGMNELVNTNAGQSVKRIRQAKLGAYGTETGQAPNEVVVGLAGDTGNSSVAQFANRRLPPQDSDDLNVKVNTFPLNLSMAGFTSKPPRTMVDYDGKGNGANATNEAEAVGGEMGISDINKNTAGWEWDPRTDEYRKVTAGDPASNWDSEEIAAVYSGKAHTDVGLIDFDVSKKTYGNWATQTVIAEWATDAATDKMINDNFANSAGGPDGLMSDGPAYPPRSRLPYIPKPGSVIV